MSGESFPPTGDTNPFSLRDALDFQLKSPPATADELAEAEAAVAELRQDQNQRKEDGVIEIDDSSGSDAAPSPTNATANTTAASSAFAASAMKPVATNLGPSPQQQQQQQQPASVAIPPPAAAAVTNNTDSNAAGNNSLRKPRKFVPILWGTLSSHTTWDEDMNHSTKTIIKGQWRFNWQKVEEAHPHHTFELTSVNENISPSGEPTSGAYVGSFGHTYVKETAKGKRSMKTHTVKEKGLKLEFRKAPDFYRVQGHGTNDLAGRFAINGTAKPAAQVNGVTTYNIELRKTYLSDFKPRHETATTTLRQQQQQQQSSVLARPTRTAPQESRTVAAPTPASPPRSSSVAVKPEPTSPEDLRQARRRDMDEDSSSGSEVEDYQSILARRQTPERRRQRQDIPRRPGAVQNTPAPVPSPPVSSSQAALPPPPTPGGVDRVNGKGMWHAWTRSFDTPLLALLDLFDNAVDASWTLLPDQQSRLNQHLVKPKIRVDLDRIGRNGVVMRNASKFIPPLHQVLQVYKSSKAGEGDNSIGENGIGVKHACASLSGLSLVFTKTTDPTNGNCTMSMGILMQELQRDDGIVLPSVAFPLSDSSINGSLDEVQEKLENHCADFPETWGVAIREYGDDHFGDGIDRCLQQMDALRRHRDWRDSDNVFAVVLANLKHAAFDNGEDDTEAVTIQASNAPAMARRNGNAGNGGRGTSTTTYHRVQKGGDSDLDEDLQRSMALLTKLRRDLPYLYLHLHDLDISVESKTIESIYWERRLVELSRFEIQLSPTELWSRMDKDRYSKSKNMANSVYKITNPAETVRFFCGFDPYRCRNQWGNDAKASSGANSDDDAVMSYVPGGDAVGGVTPMGNNAAVKIFLYSRQSGRLIKVQNDPRNELGLTAGSTDFCQGLTVIIDDHNGTLPLNPTKQDTAYGHSKHGQIHAANLKEWTAAFTHFYWTYHYERFGSSKVAVTDAVSKARIALEEASKNYRREQNNEIASGQYRSIAPLFKGNFITYRGIEFGVKSFRNNPKLRTTSSMRRSIQPVVEHLEVTRLDEDAAMLAIENKGRIYGASAKKRGRPALNDSEISRHVSDLEVASNPNKRLRDAQHNGMNPQGRSTTPIDLTADATVNQRQLQDNNNLAMENHRLKQQLQQYHNHNLRLQQSCRNATNQVMIVQNEVQKLRQELEQRQQEISHVKDQKVRLNDFLQQVQEEARRWKSECYRWQQQAGTGSSQTSAPPESPYASQKTPTRDNSDSTEVASLQQQVKHHKSRADFYKREVEAKKKQIESLMQEKSLFEDRVRELEDAQLSMESHGGDLLQF